MSTKHWGFLLKKKQRKENTCLVNIPLSKHLLVESDLGQVIQRRPAMLRSGCVEAQHSSRRVPSTKRETTLLNSYFQSGRWKELNTQQTAPSCILCRTLQRQKLHRNPRINWLCALVWAQGDKDCLQACTSITYLGNWCCQALRARVRHGA